MRREDKGTISRSKLETVETTFKNRLNGLVKSVEWVPDYDVGPKELRIELWDGIHADRSRFDVAWWTKHGYRYHYVEDDQRDANSGERDGSGLQFRFGWENRADYPDKHFHPPKNLDAHRKSCIEHEDVKRVTLAVIKCWYAAATAGDPEKVNALSNPP